MKILLTVLVMLFLTGVVRSKDQNVNPDSSDYYLFIGTYTFNESKGIYLSKFNPISGTIAEPELIAELSNPSFQCISDDGAMLWSVSESAGKGLVRGYAINHENGQIKPKTTYNSLGNGPCYVDCHDGTGHVVAANYGSGNVALIPVSSDGSTNGEPFSHQHEGSGPNASRQEGPHAHCAIFDPAGKYMYSCDLGADKIYVYTINGDKLEVYKEITTRPGAGPRHLAFHPSGKFMAVVCELNGTVETYLPDESGCFSVFKNEASTLPDSFDGFNKCADIHFTPSGQYLYASNRGHNSIAIFRVDNEPGIIDRVGWQTSGCDFTRNFCIDPEGKFLLAANRNTNNVVVFSIDNETGLLTNTGNSISVSLPVCLTLLKASPNPQVDREGE
ncbi:MAG: lactonase family protein [Prolixibacteraceae bacterium]|nr:lactonase family protein [Prolixibacteraceae bacterium]